MDGINELCEEKHKRIDERLDDHENRLNGHSERLDKLEQNDRENRTDIKHLCEQIQNLVTTMRWFIGLLMGSFVAFFFYAIQKGLFK